MEAFFAILSDFCSSKSVWVYVFIFCGKIFEVSCGTLRIVLINRGERLKGTVVAFFEIITWLLITGTVLAGYQSDGVKVIVFALAFALGNYLGSWLEERLAFGLCMIQTVLSDEERAGLVAAALRKQGFGVTSLDVHGREQNHFMLLTTLKRKLANEAIGVITEICPDAVITVSDVKTQRGGYMRAATARRGHRVAK